MHYEIYRLQIKFNVWQHRHNLFTSIQDNDRGEVKQQQVVSATLIMYLVTEMWFLKERLGIDVIFLPTIY